MRKKILYTFLLFAVFLLFDSCWIYPEYKDYEVIDSTYYFEDYETMKSVIIPKINTSFKDWHWNGEEFDKKYDKYFGNIDANTEDYSLLEKSKYNYSVRNLTRASNLKTKQEKSINGEFYWISTKDKKGVIFYQN